MFDKFINRAFVIPISEENKSVIKVCCEDIVSDITVDEYEQLCLCFLFGNPSPLIDSKIRELATVGSISIRVTPALTRNIAQYIAGAVFENDDVETDIKAMCSLALRNVLLTLRSDQVGLPFPDYLKAGVDFYETYYNDMAKIDTPESRNLIPNILLADSIDDIQPIDLNDCFDEIQYYSRIYARKQYEEFKEKIRLDCLQIPNPFGKAIYVAKMLSKQDWPFVDENPIKSILQLMTDKSVKASLACIKEKVLSCNIFEASEPLCKTSILLQYLSMPDTFRCLDEVKLSPKEFAVALYYEYVLELKQE